MIVKLVKELETGRKKEEDSRRRIGIQKACKRERERERERLSQLLSTQPQKIYNHGLSQKRSGQLWSMSVSSGIREQKSNVWKDFIRVGKVI